MFICFHLTESEPVEQPVAPSFLVRGTLRLSSWLLGWLPADCWAGCPAAHLHPAAGAAGEGAHVQSASGGHPSRAAAA